MKNLKFMTSHMAAAVTGLVIILIVLLLHNESLRKQSRIADGGDSAISERSVDRLSHYEEITQRRAQARKNSLTKIRRKWSEYLDQKDTADKKNIHKMKVDLSVETAEMLLAGIEMVSLLEFLDSKGAKSEARFVRLHVEKLFEAKDADLLVEPLFSAVSSDFSSVDDSSRLDLMRWSYLMGKIASFEHFERFKDGGIDAWPLGDFMHGWSISQANADPEGSFTMLVDFIQGGGKGSNQHQALEDVIRSFPADAEVNFQKLESILPIEKNTNEAETFENARRSILTEWAKSSPADAVNYIIDNPDRIPAEIITYVVSQAIKDLKLDGIEWVKQFPNGPYYDSAAVAVVQKLWTSSPDIAQEWALSINDESLRKTQIENIATMRTRMKRRER